MKLVITRSKWFRGEGGHRSKLIRGSDGKMCCLGFLGLACGVPKTYLLNKTSPTSISLIFRDKWPTKILEDNKDSLITHELIIVNDRLLDDGREEQLAAKFAEADIEVVFED